MEMEAAGPSKNWFLTLNIVAAQSYKTLVSYHITIRCHSAKGGDLEVLIPATCVRKSETNSRAK